MARRFNVKKKPKHMSKNRWIWTWIDEDDGYCLMNGMFCKAQSWEYGTKFKLSMYKLTKKWGG